MYFVNPLIADVWRYVHVHVNPLITRLPEDMGMYCVHLLITKVFLWVCTFTVLTHWLPVSSWGYLYIYCVNPLITSVFLEVSTCIVGVDPLYQNINRREDDSSTSCSAQLS